MSRTRRVLVADPLDTAGLEILKTVAKVDVISKRTEDQLVEIMGNYDALVVRSATKVTERVIKAGTNLTIIGRAGVGVDNVNVEAATNRGIYVVNSPQGNTIAAAEHTMGLLLSLTRNIVVADASVRAGKWEREKFMGWQLQHKTLGIVGLGQVGSHVATLAKAFGMRVIAYDPVVNEKRAETLGCQLVSLESLLRASDFVTLHVPLLESTRRMISEPQLRLMKPTARLLNCSRGGVVDEDALCAALSSGALAGAALDVFEVERSMNPATSPLLKVPNLVLTPHLGASTAEAQANVAVDVAQQVCTTLQGGIPESAVNIAGICPAELRGLAPLVACCEALGRIAVQVLAKPLESLTLTAEGQFANLPQCGALLLAAANGAIGIHTDSKVNFVNVQRVAEDRCIKLILAKDAKVAKNSVVVEVRGGAASAELRGTVTEDEDVLLKSFDRIPVFIILPLATVVELPLCASGRPSSAASNQQNVEPINLSNQSLDKDSSPSCVSPSYYNGISNNTGTRICKRVLAQFVLSRHYDVPGALAEITGALSRAGVNIANCHLGREESLRRRGTELGGSSGSSGEGAGDLLSRKRSGRGKALVIFHIDGHLPPGALDEVRRIPSVCDCMVISA